MNFKQKKSLSHLMKRCNYFRFSGQHDFRCSNFLVEFCVFIQRTVRTAAAAAFGFRLVRTCAASLLDFPMDSQVSRSGSVKPAELGPGTGAMQLIEPSSVDADLASWSFVRRRLRSYQFVEVNFSSKTSAKPFCGIPIIQCKPS